VKVGEVCGRLGLETHRAADARAAGLALVNSWRLVLDESDLTASQRARAVPLVMTQLRELTARPENGVINV
jgi:hypothetical protein